MNIKESIRRFLHGLPSRVKIHGRYIGPDEPVFVIAEIGLNDNGDLNLAKKLIDAAKEAGADAAKFQKRTTNEILTKEGIEKPYNSPHAYGTTYGEHREKLEFSREQYLELKAYAEERGILFFASVWDHKSADFLEELKIDAYKIPSADLINIPLLEHVAKKNLPVLLSTGMSTFEEIQAAVSAVVKHNHRLILFHCLSLYPSPEDKINMRFMDRMKSVFAPLPVGYSGHEIDLLPTLVAVSRGACIVERHLTLDKKMKGAVHAAALEPHQFKELVQTIRRVESILGSAEKIMYEELQPLRDKLAKSIVTRQPIQEGTRITEAMLTAKSPGSGISPLDLPRVLGRRARVDLEADVALPKEALSWKR